MAIDRLILISVGNSRTALAMAQANTDGRFSVSPARQGKAVGKARGSTAAKLGGIERVVSVENAKADSSHQPAIERAIAEILDGAAEDQTNIVIASVNERVAQQVRTFLTTLERRPKLVTFTSTGKPPTLADGAAARSYGIVEKVPMVVDLPEPITTGVDRLLVALGAFSRSGQACAVIDAGTAVTVDYVDGFGLFQGGVIVPGVGMMLRAMHEHTSALPVVEVPLKAEQVPTEAIGKTTASAMLIGVLSALRGLAHERIEAYAELAGRYPRVVATGGDAPLIFGEDGLIEHIVPDLIFVGMICAWEKVMGFADLQATFGSDAQLDDDDQEDGFGFDNDGNDDDGDTGRGGRLGR